MGHTEAKVIAYQRQMSILGPHGFHISGSDLLKTKDHMACRNNHMPGQFGLDFGTDIPVGCVQARIFFRGQAVQSGNELMDQILKLPTG